MDPKKIVSSIQFKIGKEEFYLQPADPKQTQDLLAAVKESLNKLEEFMPWAHYPSVLSLEDQIKRLAKAHHDFYLGNEFLFHLYSCDQKFLGSFGLHHRMFNPKGLELGYWVRKNEMNKGYATAASKALIIYAFEILECERLQCGFNENNKGSAKVNQKIGFIEESKLAYYEAEESIRIKTKMGPNLILNRLLKNEATALP